jgi:integrase
LADYRINQKKSLERAEISLKHLEKRFQGARVMGITTTAIKSYIEQRIEENASNATINRELAALKRMLHLGAQSTPPKVDRVPHIPMLKESNARQGFFEHGEFLAVRDALPDYLKPLVTFAYKTGWRRTEVTELKWSQVDMERGAVCLNPGETKNNRGRTVYMDEELKAVFNDQQKRKKGAGALSPYVFPNETGTDKVRDFRGAWDTACKIAGTGKRLFHDLRRTAVRDMVRAGIPERVAMMISGHQTRSVFERYNIVSEEDLRVAAIKRENYHKDDLGTISGTIVNFPKKRGNNQNG